MLQRLRRLKAPISPPDPGRNRSAIQVSLRLLAAMYRSSSAVPSFREAGFRVYSQNDEDGILHMIFAVVGAEGLAVEIGCGDGLENNTTNLIVNQGWHALLIDANESNVAMARQFFSECSDTKLFPPVVRHKSVTADNVNQVVAGFNGEIDLLSLDIDSIDYWLLSELDVVSPRVIVAETPTIWGPGFARTVPNEPRWTHAANPDFYGASLGAFDKLLRPPWIPVRGHLKVRHQLVLSAQRDRGGCLPGRPLGSRLPTPSGKGGDRVQVRTV